MLRTNYNLGKKTVPKQFFLLATLLFSGLSVTAQVRSLGNVKVHANAETHVKSYTLDFGSGIVETERTLPNYGKLSFSDDAGWINADNTKYVDGYVRSYRNGTFIYPTGNAGFFAPAKTESTTNAVIDVAYVRGNPSAVGTALESLLYGVSTLEYWFIKGSEPVYISLSWRQSSLVGDIANNDVANLTIAGYNGTEWVMIPSSIDEITSYPPYTANDSDGFLKSDFTIIPDTYQAYTLAHKKGDCVVVLPCEDSTAWDGFWTNGQPNETTSVVINTPYNGDSFTCCSITLNADLTIQDGNYVVITNGFEGGTGKIIVSSEGDLVQRSSSATAPPIELKKRTRPMRYWDYVYWGTPISGNFFSQIANARATGGTLAAFDLKYKYVSGPGGGWQNLTSIETGRGFITRVKQQAPYVTATTELPIEMTFTGVANNGDITKTVVNNPTTPNGAKSFNLLANPYPSAIDAGLFLKENPDVSGSIYLWTSYTIYGGSGQYSSGTDYAVWNLAGFTGTSPNEQDPTGYIASGQGFKVKSLVPSGDVTFTNCMRVTGMNNNFYRTEEAVKDRYWLNLTTDNGVYNQILHAYLPEATYGYDRLYDAEKNSTSSTKLYSLIDGNKFSINGRPSFEVTDVVPIGVSQEEAIATTYTISLHQPEGIFATPDVDIYLHDKELEIYHDLKTSSYVFSLNQLHSANRFDVVYQSETLGIENPSNLTVMMNLKDELFKVTSLESIDTIYIYDIAGRLVETYLVKGDRSYTKEFYHAQGVYIVKVGLENGYTVTQKLINQ